MFFNFIFRKKYNEIHDTIIYTPFFKEKCVYIAQKLVEY
jgi:hypothetical protein